MTHAKRLLRGFGFGVLLGLLVPTVWIIHYEATTPNVWPYTSGYQFPGAFVMSWFTLIGSITCGIAGAYIGGTQIKSFMFGCIGAIIGACFGYLLFFS